MDQFMILLLALVVIWVRDVMILNMAKKMLEHLIEAILEDEEDEDRRY